jgi:hypothetical protein
MPGLVPGIHALSCEDQDVDGRDEPGHDGQQRLFRLAYHHDFL